MLRKLSIALGLSLVLVTSYGALGGSWGRPDGLTPVNDAAADEIAGGQSYCPPATFSNTDFGCDLTGCYGFYCGPIAFFGSGGPTAYGQPGVVYCYVCGVNCGACNGVLSCTAVATAR